MAEPIADRETRMHRILQAIPLPDYRLQVHFTDGVQGEVDLSKLVGRGVFAAWKDRECFSKVKIGESGQLCWGDEMELCPDTIYMQVTGKTPDELFPTLQQSEYHA